MVITFALRIMPFFQSARGEQISQKRGAKREHPALLVFCRGLQHSRFYVCFVTARGANKGQSTSTMATMTFGRAQPAAPPPFSCLRRRRRSSQRGSSSHNLLIKALIFILAACRCHQNIFYSSARERGQPASVHRLPDRFLFVS